MQHIIKSKNSISTQNVTLPMSDGGAAFIFFNEEGMEYGTEQPFS